MREDDKTEHERTGEEGMETGMLVQESELCSQDLLSVVTVSSSALVRVTYCMTLHHYVGVSGSSLAPDMHIFLQQKCLFIICDRHKTNMQRNDT